MSNDVWIDGAQGIAPDWQRNLSNIPQTGLVHSAPSVYNVPALTTGQWTPPQDHLQSKIAQLEAKVREEEAWKKLYMKQVDRLQEEVYILQLKADARRVLKSIRRYLYALAEQHKLDPSIYNQCRYALETAEHRIDEQECGIIPYYLYNYTI